MGTVCFFRRFAVLYSDHDSDPRLGFFLDEKAAEPKGSCSLTGCTATQDGQIVEITVPNDKSLKLRTPTVEEAQAQIRLRTTVSCP